MTPTACLHTLNHHTLPSTSAPASVPMSPSLLCLTLHCLTLLRLSTFCTHLSTSMPCTPLHLLYPPCLLRSYSWRPLTLAFAQVARTANTWQRAKRWWRIQNMTRVAQHSHRDGRRGRTAVIAAAQFLAITPVATWTSVTVSVAICMLVLETLIVVSKAVTSTTS